MKKKLLLAGAVAILLYLVGSHLYPDIPDYQLKESYLLVSVDTLQWKMDRKASETSGLLNIKGHLITINDSGHRPELIFLDEHSGRVSHSIDVSNSMNTDWEAITADSLHIYIGDIGNNFGHREQLQIYRISISDIFSGDSLPGIVAADRIQFRYPVQPESSFSYQHNLDAEAMISAGDSLYLFTKNWKDRKCDLYSLPKLPGDYIARKLDSYNVRGLITDAYFDSEKSNLFLLGYNHGEELEPFIWEFGPIVNLAFFDAPKSRVNLKLNRQLEALCMWKNDVFLLSAERGRFRSPGLFVIPVE